MMENYISVSNLFNDLIVFDEENFLAAYDGDSDLGVLLGEEQTWTKQGLLDGVNGPMALARDSAGAIHVAHIHFLDNYEQQAEYSIWKENAWDTEMLTPISPKGQEKVGNNGVSLAIDSADRSHLALWSGYNLTYWLQANGVWSEPELVSINALARTFSIKLNSVGIPYLTFCNYERQLKIAFRDEESWDIQTLPTTCGDGRYGSVIDSDDVLHLAYFDADGSLTYGVMSLDDYSTWASEDVKSGTIPRAAGDPRNVSLALDENGFAHLAFRSFYELYHATNQSGVFVEEIIYQGEMPVRDRGN
jgi:hypothetical protein